MTKHVFGIRCLSRRLRQQEGAVLLLVTFSLILLLGLAALVVDVGRLYIIKSQLQNAADAAALRAAKDLDGTAPGAARAGTDGIAAAVVWNGQLLMAGTLQSGDVEIRLNTDPYATTGWVDPASITGPNDYYFARATVNASAIKSLFARVLGFKSNAIGAVAVAGRTWEGRILPMFIPALRRNGNTKGGPLAMGVQDQTKSTPCGGYMYDPKATAYKGGACPPGADTYLGADPSGDWGFLKPGQTFAEKYKVATGSDLPPAYDSSDVQDVQDVTAEPWTYVVIPKPNSDFNPWIIDPAGWTGNYGWLLSDPPTTTQKSILEAVCTGSIKQPYTVTGCAPVHTGGMSMPQFSDALNTRFNDFSNKKWTPEMCPSDHNVAHYPPPNYSGYTSGYEEYKANYNAIVVADGAVNRRVLRMYVIDNAWLPGYDDAVHSPCTQVLTGSTNDAHVVGCADFFMYQPADNAGLLYLEFIKRVPDAQCRAGSGPGTFSDVKLYR